MGTLVGRRVGSSVGSPLGSPLGRGVGDRMGAFFGLLLRCELGGDTGARLGNEVATTAGSCVGRTLCSDEGVTPRAPCNSIMFIIFIIDNDNELRIIPYSLLNIERDRCHRAPSLQLRSVGRWLNHDQVGSLIKPIAI